MIKMDVALKWTEACEKAFQTLKTKLTTAPVLAQLDNSKSFNIYCDSLRIGLGCVLMQEAHAISYASR